MILKQFFILSTWVTYPCASSESKFAENVLITGSNRGQGLEWVKQLSQLNEPPEHIFATCRQADNKTYTADLDAVAQASAKAKVVILQLDVTKLDEIEAATSTVEQMVGNKGLNVVINNAGIYIRSTNSLDLSNQDDMVKTYKVNSVGPVIVTQQLLPMLKRAAARALTGRSSMGTERAAIINISSRLGSITLSTGSSYSYRMSKTALVMATRLMAKDLESNGIMAVAFHPGYVSTGMTSYRGRITTFESISAMMKRVTAFNESSTGGFYERDGTTIPF